MQLPSLSPPPRGRGLAIALAFAAAACLLVACTGTDVVDTAAGAAAPLAFIVVRHAEKVDDSRDPDLSAVGQARARALAEQLRDVPLVAAWTSAFARTRQTGRATAQAHGLELREYDAAMPATDLAEMLRREHRHGTVLVVGHSNTVPDIVAALCGCEVDPIDDATYGGRYDIEHDVDGRRRLRMGTF
jgi:phosphohistidine phosphatase SixA